jgi:hypothetical protein
MAIITKIYSRSYDKKKHMLPKRDVIITCPFKAIVKVIFLNIGIPRSWAATLKTTTVGPRRAGHRESGRTQEDNLGWADHSVGSSTENRVGTSAIASLVATE